MSEKRKRVLVVGVLLICLLSLFWTEGYNDRRVIDLNELISAIGAWACAVWLWPGQAPVRNWTSKVLFPAAKKSLKLLFWAAVYLSLPAIAIAHHFGADAKILAYTTVASMSLIMVVMIYYGRRSG